MCEGVACKDIEAIRDLCTEKGWWLVEDRPGKAGEKGEFSKRNGSLTFRTFVKPWVPGQTMESWWGPLATLQ